MRRHCHFGRLLPAKRTRALPLPDSDSPPLLSRVISPDDSPASRMPSLYFLAPFGFAAQYSVPFSGANRQRFHQSRLSSPGKHEMIICCLISQCFIWWPSEKSLGEHRDPISEAIKQSSDWDHSTNPPYLFSKLSPGPLSWFPPNLTATRAVHPWPLQRMSSCR